MKNFKHGFELIGFLQSSQAKKRVGSKKSIESGQNPDLK